MVAPKPPADLRQERQPLIERYPVGFWRGVALISVLLNLVLALVLLRRQ
jgi:hypothetical protein